MQTQRVIAYLLPIFTEMLTSVLHNTNATTVPLFYDDRWNLGAHWVRSKELVFQMDSFHEIVMQVDVA